MAIQLRDYQIKANKNLVQSILKGNKKILFCSPVGSGKTVMFSDFAKRTAERGYKTLIVVDRIELLKQTIRQGSTQSPFGYLTANKFRPAQITVAMLQTLRARLKQEAYQDWLGTFDFIFVDEIHQVALGSSITTIQNFIKDSATFIGITATPWNAKGYLLDGFDDFIKVAEISELIEQGYLVRPEHYTIDLFDFGKVKITSTGDYDTGEIDDIVVDTNKMDKVFDGWAEKARHLKTIAFCSTVLSASEYANFFKLNDIKAEVVSAKNTNTEREEILEKFKKGEIEILFNVGLLVAGFDEPSIECVLFLNPTKILRRYIQCAGRGLRLCPQIGKEKCLFIDFVGNSFRHLEVDAIRSYIKAPPKQPQEDFDEIQCPACGFVFPITEHICPECGFCLDIEDDCEGSSRPPKNKKEFEKLIKLKSVQQELHDTLYEFAGKYCLIKLEETGKLLKNGKPERKWCYGYRDDGSPVFKTSEDYTREKYPYPVVTQAKKSNCWFVFHSICVKFDPKLGALRYYGRKLRKAKRFLAQIKDERNKAFVNLYNIID